MKTDPQEKPENQKFPKPTAKDESVACRKAPQTAGRAKDACEPFEAILEAYAQHPERWDGLE